MAQLSIKQAIKQSVEMLSLKSDRDHANIEAARLQLQTALNDLDSVSTVTYGDIVSSFGTTAISDYKLSDGAMDLNSYTTASRLNLNTATNLAIGISKVQANKDHQTINQLINAQASNAAITDSEILACFDETTQTAYKRRHTPDTYNYLTDPNQLLKDLNASPVTNGQFNGFSSGIDGNTITITNGTDNIAFTVDELGETATSTDFTVTYATGTVVSNS